MESNTGQPLLFYQLLGLKDSEHPAVGLVLEEQQLRVARETLAVTMRQTAKAKADLLEKYRAKQQEATEVEAKLLRMLHVGVDAEPSLDGAFDDVFEDGDDAHDDGLQHQVDNVIDSAAGRVLVDKRAEKRLRDKLARHNKNLADLRRKLVEEDKRERARRRKVRAKRGDALAQEELYMEDWETILTHTGPDDAERYLASVHERRLEHEFLLQAVSVRMEELARREEQVVEKLTHALKLQYRKIALRYHPDRSDSESSTEMFQLLSKAYAVVGDTQKRRVYNDMGNHTLYLCVHEQDKDELRMADIRDAKKAKKNGQHDVLRITSGGPAKMRCPTVKFIRSRIHVSWTPLDTSAGYRYAVGMEADGLAELITLYEGTDNHCVVAVELAEGDYQFRVRASNSLGAGEWSEPAFASVLEGGGMVDPFGRAEKMQWQQAKQEAIREEKRKRRRRKEQKKKDRRLQEEQRSEAEKLLLQAKQTSQQIMQMINREKLRDLERLIDRLLGEEHDDRVQRLQMVVNWTNARGETPLVVAAMKGVTAAVKLLLDKLGRHVNLDDTDNQHGRTALIWGAVNGDADTLHALTTLNKREGGTRMNVNWQDYEGHTALHWAAELGLSDAVSWLLRQPDVDVDIEAYDNSHTPLHAAASHGHLLIVQMLYQKADKSKYASYGGDGAVLSPAFLALMNEHYDVAMWLVRAEEKRLGKESDPQAVRQLKESLLHLAAMLDSVDVLRLLIEGAYGADIDARDSEGNTALHLAYQVGNDDTVAYLRDSAGCDAQAVNHRGLTPAQLQPGHGHDESEEDEEDEQSESEDNEAEEESEDECESDVEQGLPEEARENAEQVVREECYLENLPQEIILRTSSFFQTLAEDNILWRTIFLRTFPFCFEASRSQTNWRSAFANQIAMKKRCAICSRVDQLRVCSGCRLVHYCGPEHQNLHWRVNHRGSCEGPFRLLSGVKRLVAEERSKERVQKALSIFGLVELSLKNDAPTLE